MMHDRIPQLFTRRLELRPFRITEGPIVGQLAESSNLTGENETTYFALLAFYSVRLHLKRARTKPEDLLLPSTTRFAITLIGLATITACVQPSLLPGERNSQQLQVEHALRAYFDAFAAQDRDSIRQLTTKDFVLFENGYPLEFARFTEVWDTKRPRNQRYQLGDLQVQIVDSVALFRYSLDWFAGDEPVSHSIETGIARHSNGQWQFSAGIAGILAAGAAAQTISPPANSSFHQSAAQFALSPDGGFVGLVAIQKGQAALWVQRLGARSAIRLAGTEDASYPFWSPDARHIGFFANGKLKTTSVDGGAVNVLCDSPNGRGGSWGSEGNIIFSPSPSDVLFRVPSGGGSCTPLTRVAGDTERSHRWPQFLPDGRHFLYLVTHKFDTKRSGEVRIGSLDSSDPVSLGIRTPSRATYGAGHILFMRDDTLTAVKLDIENLHAVGESFSVAAYVRTDDNLYTSVSASSTGMLLSQRDSTIRKTRLMWMDRNGKVVGSIGEPGQYMNIELAPDDRRVAVSLVSGTPANRDVWVIDGARGTAARLTSDPANDAVPLWSRDSRSIVFESYRTGPPSIFRTATRSPGNEVQLLNSGSNDIPEDWSADGKFVTFTRSVQGTSLDLWILPLNGSQSFPFLATTANEDDARFDPSGRWIAYTSNASGRYEVYVRPFPVADGEYRVSRDGGRSPIWRADGKELFFLTPDGTLMASAIDRRQGFRSGEPRLLFRTGVSEMVTAGNAHQYAVSRDGRRFLINRSDPHDDVTPVTTVLNWPPISR